MNFGNQSSNQNIAVSPAATANQTTNLSFWDGWGGVAVVIAAVSGTAIIGKILWDAYKDIQIAIPANRAASAFIATIELNKPSVEIAIETAKIELERKKVAHEKEKLELEKMKQNH